MGSVTIYLLVEKSLTAAGVLSATEDDGDDFHFESMSHILPADSSLAELMDLVELKSFTNEQKLRNITILDLSYNPVKNISSIVRMNTEHSGPMSKTLHYMSWYPSGKLCILPLSSNKSMTDTDIEKRDELMLQRFLKWQSRNVVQEEDFAYNNPAIQNQRIVAPSNNRDGVKWTGVGAGKHHTEQIMKPSEIFSAVSNRDHNDYTHQDEQSGQKKPPAKKKRSEKQRTQRLDALIQNLAQTTSKDGKKKRVSDKVRTMLIKSRADGNTKLRMEDRFHLEILQLIDDGDMSASNAAASNETAATSYKFFSRVTTAGKVASCISGSICKTKSVELLVSSNKKNYRRLPNMMSLHDAQQAGWLQEFDAVVIRTFSLERDDEFGQSKSVLDPESDVDSENEAGAMEIESRSVSCSNGALPADKDACDTEVDAQADHLQHRLHMIYNMTSGEKSTKKKKPVSKQVQRMLMKSKSTGNKVIKPDDRVHLDTVIFYDNGSEDIDGAYSSSFRFFSKRTSVENLASTFQDEKAKNVVEIVVSQPCKASSIGCVYQNLLPSKLTLEEAVKQGLLEDFGRIIVRLTSSGCHGHLPPP